MIDKLYVIPARMKSTRFPGKPLAKIWGTEMILLTYNRLVLAGVSNDHIIVAIDNNYDLVKVLKTNKINYEIVRDAITGTDRVAEIARRIPATYYVNLQGDEPLMPLENIQRMSNLNLEGFGAAIGYCKIATKAEQNSPKVPKIVFSTSGDLIYISRSSIPGSKFKDTIDFGYKQICIYIFNREILLENYNNIKTPLEQKEDIEILRLVELGQKVKCVELLDSGISVDFKEDINHIENYYERGDYLGF